jgi:hypothetical protein
MAEPILDLSLLILGERRERRTERRGGWRMRDQQATVGSAQQVLDLDRADLPSSGPDGHPASADGHDGPPISIEHDL